MHIVIGAGIIGASVAYFLARQGAAVTVIDAGRIAGGTSTHSFAWVNAIFKPPRHYHDLNVAGMRAHQSLRQQWLADTGSAPWWHGGGTVAWQSDSAAFMQRVTELQTWGYPAAWISPAELAALEPDLALNAVGDWPLAYFADDGWVDPAVYCQALLAAARQQGAQVLPHTRATNLLRQGRRIAGVQLADGQRLQADWVINCSGRWADQSEWAQAQPIPLAPTGGLMLFTPPLAHGLQRVIFSPQVHIRPDGAGRLLVCRNDLELPADARPADYETQARQLLNAAAELLPLLHGVDAEALRVGVRAQPQDSFPAVGPTPGVDGYYSVVTHSGVTLAPYLGQAVADEIVRGQPQAALDAFRPGRFLA